VAARSGAVAQARGGPPLLSQAAKIPRTESYHSDRSEVGFGLGYLLVQWAGSSRATAARSIAASAISTPMAGNRCRQTVTLAANRVRGRTPHPRAHATTAPRACGCSFCTCSFCTRRRRCAIPLPAEALALLGQPGAPDALIFPARDGGPLHITSPLTAFREQTDSNATLHGWRSTFSTWAAEKRADRDLRELCLAHKVDRGASPGHGRMVSVRHRRLNHLRKEPRRRGSATTIAPDAPPGYRARCTQPSAAIGQGIGCSCRIWRGTSWSLGRSESITQPLLEKSGTVELPCVARVAAGALRDGSLRGDQPGCCGRRWSRRPILGASGGISRAMESVDRYRAYASDCLRLGGTISDPTSKAGLLDMARAWVRLAELATKNSHLDLVYEPPARSFPELPFLPRDEGTKDIDAA
jgi:hypothetical protein